MFNIAYRYVCTYVCMLTLYIYLIAIKTVAIVLEVPAYDDKRMYHTV